MEMAVHLHFLPLLLLLLLQLLVSSPLLLSLAQPPGGGGSDLVALLEFKKEIRDDSAGHALASWSADSTAAAAGTCPGSWYGVTCDVNGAVVALSLGGLGLGGDLKFSTIIGLTSLRNLSLTGNDFTGRLVPGVGAMVSLQHLDLSGNRFYGPIPERITELSGLVTLNLSRNGFSGGLPSGLWRLQQLRVLDLASNGLQGDVGLVLSELRNVEHLDLSHNTFYGQLGMSSANLSSLASTLKLINLQSNKLNGDFFAEDALQLFMNLQVLDVSNNQLTGELPSFESLTNLRVLRAGRNWLYGSLRPELLGSSMALMEVDLSGNGFTGSLFDINSTSLRLLNLSSNGLSGSLPSSVGSCNSVDLSMNMISGNLSNMQNWGSMLEVVDLSSNMLSGAIPNLTSQFKVWTSIKIRNNSIVGLLPPAFGSSPLLSVIDLSLNRLTGPLLPSFFTSLSLKSLNLSGNQFTGTLPIHSPHSTESLVLPSVLDMELLDLSDNSLSGPLPPEIVKMQKLKVLSLGKNSFSGSIPSEIGKLDGLEAIDLSMNHFEGQIPDIPQASLRVFNVSYNTLSGPVPESLRKFHDDSFHPGNALLVLPGGPFSPAGESGFLSGQADNNHRSKSRVRIAIIVGSIGAVLLVFFIFMAVYKVRTQELCGRNGFSQHTSGRDAKLGRFIPSNIFRSHKNDAVATSVSFSNDHLLTSAASRALPARREAPATEAVERGFDDGATAGVLIESSPGSPLYPSARFADADFADQPVVPDVRTPDRLAGELFFLDNSLLFTAENLSRAPAEVLGRSSHGTSYRATLEDGRMLTVKWLRAGLVRRKKEFAKEARRIGSIRHPNIIPLRGYYWGPGGQERLLLSDYIDGDSLALHLHESTPRRHPPLSLGQRLKVAIDVAGSLCHLHNERGLPHGNLKPANVVLVLAGAGAELAVTAKLADYGLHRLMTPGGTAEQMLNLGALGYGAPEAVRAAAPSPRADVYALGVVVMELLTGRSAGDIVSGQSGAVDLADWVGMCAREGRLWECFDGDVAGRGEDEAPKAMEELAAVALRCVLPADERPGITAVFHDLCSISSSSRS